MIIIVYHIFQHAGVSGKCGWRHGRECGRKRSGQGQGAMQYLSEEEERLALECVSVGLFIILRGRFFFLGRQKSLM